MLSGRDRAAANRSLQSLQTYQQHDIRVFYVIVETPCSLCGQDVFGGGGIDPACPSCGGEGSVKQYATHRILARVSWPRLSDYVLGVAGGIEVGDAILYINLADKDVFERAERKGYVLLDGERYGIKTIDTAGLGAVQEYAVTIGKQSQ